MAIDQNILSVPENVTGINKRWKKLLSALPAHTVSLNEKALVHFIQADEYGEYTFYSENFSFFRSGYQAFYDGKERIMECYYDDKKHRIVLNILSKKQVNLFVDLISDECIIHSKGAICIDATLVIKDVLAISATACCFLEKIQCEGTIKFTAEQSVFISSTLVTQNLDIHTAYYSQTAEVKVLKHSEITTQVYQQNANGITHFNTANIVTEQCEIAGVFKVEADCFLTANRLILGDSNSEINTKIKFLGEHHIHTIFCLARSGANLLVSTEKTLPDNHFIIDEYFSIENGSEIHLKNSSCTSDLIENYGVMTVENSHLCVDRIDQNHVISATTSSISVSSQFAQKLNTSSSLFTQTVINSHATTVSDGELFISDSEWSSERLYIYSGALKIDSHSDFQLSELICFEESSSLLVDSSNVTVQLHAMLYGRATFSQSRLNCDSLRSNKALNIDSNTTIHALNQAVLFGEFFANNSTIYSAQFQLHAQSETHALSVYSPIIECLSKSLSMEQLIFSGNYLKIVGNEVTDADAGSERIVFRRSHLSAQRFCFSENLLLEESFLVGTYGENICHDIQGRLILKKSQIITESQIHQLEANRHIQLLEFSTIRSGLIYSNADMIASGHSSIHAKNLLKQGGSLTLQESQAHLQQNLMIKNTEVKLEASSTMTSSNAFLEQNSSLRLTGKSLIAVSHKLTSQKGTELQSEQSTLCVKKFITLGRNELKQTILSASELLIYDKFSAENKTVVHVEEATTIAQQAQVLLEESALETKELDNFGKMIIESSHLQAHKTMSLWSTSETTLKGRAQLSGDSLRLSGQLKLEKNIEPSEGEAATCINMKSRVDVFEKGKITGDVNLMLLAEEINQTGTVNLSANFTAKGRQFSNLGSTTADVIYLGFDDTVINHGRFSANSMMVHSSFMNILGSVYARQSFSCSGIASINLGFISANNYCNDSLFSLSAGLVLPNFCADPKYIFSLGNLALVARTMATTLMPTHSYGINLVAMIPGLISTGTNLFNLISTHGLDKVMSMRRHEYIPIFCQLKNAVMFSQGFFSTIQGMQNEYTNWSSGFNDFFSDPSAWGKSTWTKFTEANWSDIGLQATGALAGNYTDTSLVHVNMGASLVGNTSKTNCLHLNLGSEQSFFSHNINTQVLHNQGQSSGRYASFSARKTYNDGTLEGTDRFTFQSEQVKNTSSGRISGGAGVNVKIDTLEQEGELSLNKGQANIGDFISKKEGETSLTEIALSGCRLDFKDNSHLTTEKCLIKESEHVVFDEATRLDADSTSIETKNFLSRGHIEHKNGLSIHAETVTLDAGSVMHGAKTREEELFVPVEHKPEQKTDAASDDSKDQAQENTNTGTSKETEKNAEESKAAGNEQASEQKQEQEFRPKNILEITAKKTMVDGELSGGDYSIIRDNNPSSDADKKTERIGELIVGDSAKIDLERGQISERTAHFSGNIKLKKFNVEIDQSVIDGNNQALELIDSSYKGQSLQSDGHLTLDHSYLQVDSVHLSDNAHEKLNSSHIQSQDCIDHSQMQTQGQSGIHTEHYEHFGRVESAVPLATEGAETKNLFYVETQAARLEGSSNVDHAYYAIEHFSDRAEFVSGTGRYSAYFASESFTYSGQDAFDLNGTIHRNCDLSIQGTEVRFGVNYNSQHNLSLVSTTGDIVLASDVQAANFYASSARSIYGNHQTSADSVISLEAKGGYYNLGGSVSADTVAIRAAEIKNITQDSHAGSQGSGLAVGGSGVINGRTKLFAEATVGNIENHGGIFRAGDYAQLVASGSVLNLCNEHVSQGQYDVIRTFDGGLISGGNGAETEGVGLYIKAGGKVISDASDFVSNGSNYIEGAQGVEFTARQHTYISRDTTEKSKFKYKKTHIVETDTIIRGSTVHSNNGRNIIQSSEGGVSSVATRFSSPGGTDVYAKGDIKLYSLRANNMHYESVDRGWGISHKERQHVYDISTPTLFVDNGITRIVSESGSIDARGAYFIGDGDLYMKAQMRIQLGVDILNHEVTEKTRGIDVSGPGLGAWGSIKNGGNLWDAMTAEDTTLAKLNALMGSHNAAELVTSSSNFGIDLYNTTNSFMRGLTSHGAITEELLARYGLGGAGGFSPSVTVTASETKSKSSYQTQSEGGINRGGNVKLEAGSGIDLENGVQIYAGGNVEIDTPELRMHAAELHSRSKQETHSISTGVKLFGQPETIGAAVSKTKTSSTNYIHSEIRAGGNVSLHHQGKAMSLVELDGASIQASTLDMQTDRLVIRDKQDISQTKTKSASINSDGSFSIHKGKGHERVTNQHSGLNITEGINTNGHVVKVTETEMEGGVIKTSGENHFTTDKLTTRTLVDERKYTSTGISGNIHDFDRVIDQRPENTAGEKAIATESVSFSRVDQVASQKAVIHGEAGTHIEVKELQGELHTTSSDGREVLRDREYDITIDVPVTNRAYIEESQKNIREGEGRLKDLILPEKTKDHHDSEQTLESYIPEIDLEKFEQLESLIDEKSSQELDTLQQAFNSALDNIELDSPEAKKIVELAQHELQENGSLSPETEKLFQEKIGEAFLQVVKASSEAGWGKFVDSLGIEYSEKLTRAISNADTLEELGIKSYLGGKGLLITMTFNLMASSVDKDVHQGEVLKEATARTATDISIGLVLKYGAKAAAGHVGWGLTSLGVLDTLFYDQQRIDHMSQRGLTYLNETENVRRTHGGFFKAWATRQAAADQIGAAARAQAGHILVHDVPEALTKGFKKTWDKVTHHEMSQQAQPSITQTEQGFFKSESSQTEANSKVNKYNKTA